MTLLQDCLKRCFDIIVSLIALIVFSPLFLLIALAIKLTSKGPVMFYQERLCRGAAEFTLFKFRTMIVNAPDLRNPDGSTFNSATDNRVTRVGRILRSTSLDELPQLLNVLLGSMSLVGPRPDQVDQEEFYVGNEWKKNLVKPGITGLAQINGRNAISWAARKQLDLEYVERQSLSLDLEILLKTIPYVLNRGDVYVNQMSESAQ
jgi:lipopolysaccharide/colanic/teichoic acid biosynthesis glycosyltransferase